MPRQQYNAKLSRREINDINRAELRIRLENYKELINLQEEKDMMDDFSDMTDATSSVLNIIFDKPKKLIEYSVKKVVEYFTSNEFTKVLLNKKHNDSIDKLIKRQESEIDRLKKKINEHARAELVEQRMREKMERDTAPDRDKSEKKTKDEPLRIRVISEPKEWGRQEGNEFEREKERLPREDLKFRTNA